MVRIAPNNAQFAAAAALAAAAAAAILYGASQKNCAQKFRSDVARAAARDRGRARQTTA